MKKVYFPQHGGVATEQNLVQDLVDEQIKLFGSDVFYIPRVHLKDKSLGCSVWASYRILNDEGELTLDDMTIEDISKELRIPFNVSSDSILEIFKRGIIG